MITCHKISVRFAICIFAGILLSLTGIDSAFAQTKESDSPGVRVSTFDVDATPPVGSLLTYDPEINKWDLGLRARGIVILGAGQPIVLCSVDWIGIANEGQDAFRQALAEAAGTIPERVTVHTVHRMMHLCVILVQRRCLKRLVIVRYALKEVFNVRLFFVLEQR